MRATRPTPGIPEGTSDSRNRAPLDVRGMLCPLPVIALARAASGLSAGTVIVVLADDVAARSDIPAWTRLKGHRVSLVDEGPHTRYTVVLGPFAETTSASVTTSG